MVDLPPDYLNYPRRRYGMDHERYEWSMLPRRKPVEWPGGARIALWIVPALEWFPLDMKGVPFKPPGAMQTAYPDLRHYTLRDYGNRVGIYRVMAALKKRGLTASVAVNAAVAKRYPSLLRDVAQCGWEVIANGQDMDHLHHGGLSAELETEIVETALATLQRASSGKIRGWLSPAKSELFATPDIVAAAGLDYLCDWINDDMPFAMETKSGRIHCMPHPGDIDDYTILIQNHHDEDEFRDQVLDQFDVLHDEAERFGGRIMAISLHPWIIGQPHRIGTLEAVLDAIVARGSVWCATGADILDAWMAQQ